LVTLSMPVGACLPSQVPAGEAAPRLTGSDPGSGVAPAPGPLEAPAPVRTLSVPARDALLAELLRQHYGTVWRTLRRVGIDADRVDDAAQEVFIVLSRKLEFIEEGRERNYLLSASLRVAANFRRAHRARREVLDDRVLEDQTDPVPSADRLIEQKRLREVLDEVLERFPADIRTAFVLFELEGLSVPEIAELTETKVGTVSSRLRRARELFLAASKRLKARGAFEGGSP
jgi:RNA polymerase sigma-70 factor (ECF subfamily)